MAFDSCDNPAVQAQSPGGLCDLVRSAIESGQPIIDYGRAHRGVGHRPPAEGVRVSLTGGVIEHYARDLTVRVSAGMPLGDLQTALAETNQFLPIDADADLTIGEIINHHVYGGMRVGYGSVRDLLLGLGFVDGLGREVLVGGRTVKNVAGYDLTRMMVGGLGEFGYVYEATLRTYAMPSVVCTAELAIDGPAGLDQIVTGWLSSDAAPTQLSIAFDGDRWTGKAGYHAAEPTDSYSWVDPLKVFIAKAAAIEIAEVSERLFADDVELAGVARSWRREASALVKVIVPPGVTGTVCAQIASWRREGVMVRIDALPVHGCIFVGGSLNGDEAAGLDKRLSLLTDKHQGLRVWYARPLGGESIEPFGGPRPDRRVLADLKHAMDPHTLFNPGRYLPVQVGRS